MFKNRVVEVLQDNRTQRQESLMKAHRSVQECTLDPKDHGWKIVDQKVIEEAATRSNVDLSDPGQTYLAVQLRASLNYRKVFSILEDNNYHRMHNALVEILNG